jgi:asparagine synthase (glutamine-hydrolysing)
MLSDVEISIMSLPFAAACAVPPDAELAPGFVAIASDDPIAETGLPGRPVWADTPWIRIYGNWRPEEIRRVRHPRGRLLVMGHCLFDSEQVTNVFTAAMDSADLTRLTGMPGAYTCLIVRPGELIAITDVAGQFPVYHTRHGQETLVGLHPGILAARHGRTPDPITAAARIACPNVLPLWSDRAPYREIHAVGGGAVLHVRDGRLRVSRDLPVPVERTTRQEGAMALRAALVQAIEGRCRAGPISSDFSGGLDSTSLALLAARYSPHPIHAVTYHNPLVPAADMADASRCARLDSTIVLAVVRGTEETLPYRAITTDAAFSPPYGAHAALTSEPALGALAWRRAALRLSQVAAREIRVHLTGEGGDAVLGAPPAYLADLARHGSVARLFRHCAAHARLRRTSPTLLAGRALRTAVTRPATALGRLAGFLHRPASGTLGWPDAISWWPTCGEAVNWLTGHMRTSLAEIAIDPLTTGTIPDHAGPADVMTLTEVRHSANAQRHLREFGHRFGIAVHAPFLDGPVVRACLQVPSSQRADPWTCKPLLGAALTGLIPHQVFDRRTKGDYTAEEYRGARGAAPRLRSLLHDSRLADLGVIEPARVHGSLDRLFAGVMVPLWELNQLLATELWLRDLERTDTQDRF